MTHSSFKNGKVKLNTDKVVDYSKTVIDHENQKVYLAFKDKVPDDAATVAEIVPVDKTTDDKLPYPSQIRHRVEAGARCGSGIKKGWFEIVAKLDDELTKLYPFYVVDQIKEKFGTLRYYVSGFPDDFDMTPVNELLEEAYNTSSHICDVCGEVGSTYKVEWLMLTRCEKHNKKIRQKL